MCKFKAKDYEVNAAPLCLDKVSKEFWTDIMKKPRLNRYVDYSVHYDIIDFTDIIGYSQLFHV